MQIISIIYLSLKRIMKNILITGGSRGIGKEIVKICHINNFKVHFTYSNNLVSAK